MKRWLTTLLFVVALAGLNVAYATEDTHKNQQGQGHTVHGQGHGYGHTKSNSQPSKSNTIRGQGNARIGVQSKPGEITVRGVSNGAVQSPSGRATGSASGILRITWGTGGSGSDSGRTGRSGIGRTPMSPPGASELPAPFMFGTGLAVFGLGLLLYRRRMW